MRHERGYIQQQKRQKKSGMVYREQLAGDRRAELDRLEQQDAEIAALELAEAEKLRNAELQYRMELEVSISAIYCAKYLCGVAMVSLELHC